MGKKKLFSEVPYIEGERLLIKRITQDDAGALGMIVDYLENDTDIEIIAASSLPDNSGSAGILRKCGFELVVHNGPEGWGSASRCRQISG